MIFRVCEHYDDNLPIIEKQYNDCCICFEYITDNENKPTNLQKQRLYLNNCMCDVAVHNFCLKKWFDKYKSCPICRINVIENNNETLIIYNCMPYGIKIYTFIKKISTTLVRILSIMLILHMIIEYYLIIIREKYVRYNHDTYTPVSLNFNETDKIN